MQQIAHCYQVGFFFLEIMHWKIGSDIPGIILWTGIVKNRFSEL